MDKRIARAAHVMTMVMRHSTAARFTITIEHWQAQIYMEDELAEWSKLTYVIRPFDDKLTCYRK